MKRYFLQNKIWVYALLSGVAVSLTSCIKEDFSKVKSAQWEPEFAFPLAKTTVTVDDLLTDSLASFLEIDEEGLPTMVYTTSLFSFTASDILDIPDTSQSTTIDLSDFTIAPPPDGATITVGDPDPLVETVDFNAGSGVLLDSIKIKSGNLQLAVTSELKHDFTIYFAIPDAHDNSGKVFSDSIVVFNSGTSGGATYTTDIDLAGYTFGLTKDGTTNNQFDVEVKVKITKGPDDVAGDEETVISESFTNLEFDALYGYIGQQTIPEISDSLEISALGKISSEGNLNLADPSINLILSNGYGVPIQMDFTEFGGYTPGEGFFSVLSNGADSVLIEGPGYNRIGDTVITTAVFNNTNIDLNGLLQEAPQYLIYALEGVTNPSGNIAPNFVLDTSDIDIDLEVRIPMYLSATGITLTDTMEFSEISSLEQIDHMGLLINVTNGLPLELSYQVYFLDSTYQLLDSLFDNTGRTVESAKVDATTGLVTQDTQSKLEITVPAATISNIEKARYARVDIDIATYLDGAVNVKLLTSYGVSLKIGGLLGISTDLVDEAGNLNDEYEE